MNYIKFFLFFLPAIVLSQQKNEAFRQQLIQNKTYEYVYKYVNNYAVVRTFKGKMGLIDTTGTMIIKPKYDYINNEDELKNLYEVGNNVNKKFKRGFIYINDVVKIPLTYDEIYYLKNGLIRVTKENKTGVLDTLNRLILPLKFDYIMNDNGILFTQTKNANDLFDSSGKQLTNYQAKDIAYFTGDKTIVTLQNNNTLIINDKGELVLNTIKNHTFEKVLDRDTFLIQNTITKKKGIVNSIGKFKIECKYDDILPSKSIYIASYKNKYGFITKTDSILKPFIYDRIYTLNHKDDALFKNLYNVKRGDFEGIVNPFTEKEILPITYKSIQVFYTDFAVTNAENKNGLYSEKGEVIIPEEFEFYNGFQNKIFASKNNKNYLLIFKNLNYSTEEVLAEEFLKRKYFADGIKKSKYQIAKNQNKFGVISYENKTVIPFEFDSIEEIYATGEFVVKKNKKYGIVNGENKIVLELKYDSFQIIKEVVKFRITNDKNPKFHVVKFENNVR